MPANEEVGLELGVQDLKEKVIYALEKHTRRGIFVTLWCDIITPEMVWFLGLGDQIVIRLILFVGPDGFLRDDTKTQIHVYEYLGPLDPKVTYNPN